MLVPNLFVQSAYEGFVLVSGHRFSSFPRQPPYELLLETLDVNTKAVKGQIFDPIDGIPSNKVQ